MDEQNQIQMPEEASDVPAKQRRSAREVFYEFFEEACVVTVLVILLFMFVGRMATVVGGSMQHTLEDGERIVMLNLFYTPKRGDVVVVNKESGHYADELIIKRIIAKENDVVSIDYDTWTVTVNGEVLSEPYVNREAGAMDREDMVSDTFVVPEGCYFVMGDNRNHSTDSRSDLVGFVKKSEIVGKAAFRLFPLNAIGPIN